MLLTCILMSFYYMGVRADHGNYIITMYRRNKLYEEKKKKKRKEKDQR